MTWCCEIAAHQHRDGTVPNSRRLIRHADAGGPRRRPRCSVTLTWEKPVVVTLTARCARHREQCRRPVAIESIVD